MDWNDCPQSIGIPVRNRRNPQVIRHELLLAQEIGRARTQALRAGLPPPEYFRYTPYRGIELPPGVLKDPGQSQRRKAARREREAVNAPISGKESV